MQYHHRQFGTVIVAILAATIIFMSLPLIRSQEFHAIQLQVVLVLLAAIALFYALTIEIRDDTLYIRMGIGLIRRKVPLSDIARARVVRIPIYRGLGHPRPARRELGVERLRAGWRSTGLCKRRAADRRQR